MKSTENDFWDTLIPTTQEEQELHNNYKKEIAQVYKKTNTRNKGVAIGLASIVGIGALLLINNTVSTNHEMNSLEQPKVFKEIANLSNKKRELEIGLEKIKEQSSMFTLKDKNDQMINPQTYQKFHKEWQNVISYRIKLNDEIIHLKDIHKEKIINYENQRNTIFIKGDKQYSSMFNGSCILAGACFASLGYIARRQKKQIKNIQTIYQIEYKNLPPFKEQTPLKNGKITETIYKSKLRCNN